MTEPVASRRIVFQGLSALGVAAVLAGCGGDERARGDVRVRRPARRARPSPRRARPSRRRARPSPSETSPSRSQKPALATTDEVPVGGGIVLTGQKIVIVQPTAGKFRAWSAICKHEGELVGSVESNVITCPCHGSQFDSATGDVVGGPAPDRAGPDRHPGRRATGSRGPERACRPARGRSRASVGRAASAGGRAVRPARRGRRRSRPARSSAQIRVSSTSSRWASEPPSRGTSRHSRASRSAASEHRPSCSSTSARASGATTSRWVGCACRSGPVARAGAGRPRSSSASSATAACMARNGVAGRSRTSRPATSATSAMSGTRSAPGVIAQRNSSDPLSTSARQPRPCSGRSCASYRRRTAAEVAQRQLVQRRVPREVAQALGRRAVAGHPVVHPGQPGLVVAGLVVRVRAGVRGVAGGRLVGQRAAGQLHRLVEPALLLAHERQQAGEPPVVAVRRGRALDDRPRLLRAPR